MALKQRLAPDGSLQKLDPEKTFLGDTISFNICQEKYYSGDKSDLCRLPDRASALAWSEYASTGTVKDTTPPDKPYGLRIIPDSDSELLTWRAEADIESGIGCFNIYKDGEIIGRVPSEGVFQGYDTNGDQARPVIPPKMEFQLPAGQWKELAVETVNRDGLASEKAVLPR